MAANEPHAIAPFHTCMLTIVVCFFLAWCSLTALTYSLLPYRWFPAKRAQRSPEKVNSLVYKDYTLVEHEDGTKAYVSPQEKARLLLDGKLKPLKLTLQSQKTTPPALGTKDLSSGSDSEYEVPVLTDKSKPSVLHTDLNGDDETSPGDNGRINLPPYMVPLETSLTLPMTKQKRLPKKKRSKQGEGDAAEVEARARFSLKEPSWARKGKGSDAEESPEDAEVREITEGRRQRFSLGNGEAGSEEARDVEEGQVEGGKASPKESEGSRRFLRPFSLPQVPTETQKARERRMKKKKLDTNPLRNMFGMRGVREAAGGGEGEGEGRRRSSEEEAGGGGILRRYNDAALSEVQSDTESADHGSADKSSVTKLTNEKQPKKLMSGLLGSFRKGKNKDKVADNDPTKNPSSFEITLKEQTEDAEQAEAVRTEGIVYAELDMARSPGSVMRRDDEKTEYAEIIYPGTKPTAERAAEELRKSREDLASSRENLPEVDEAFSTTPEGKKEAAV